MHYLNITKETKHRRLNNFIRTTHECESAKQVLDDWGIEIDRSLFDSPAGKFAPEKLAFGGGNEISAANEAEWGLNIAMQMACKQGGHDHNHITYHDPSDEARSVFGVVPSMNRNATRWYSRCFFQNQREEIVNNLGLAITAALKKYYEVNGIIPGKIFFYRGGVGDDDVPIVREYEIPQLETALINYVKNKPELTKPQLGFIVVQNRVKITHITGRNLLNLPPGSVINHTDTRRQFYDFYLVSQHVHHGTVTPTHYISLNYNYNSLV